MDNRVSVFRAVRGVDVEDLAPGDTGQQRIASCVFTVCVDGIIVMHHNNLRPSEFPDEQNSGASQADRENVRTHTKY